MPRIIVKALQKRNETGLEPQICVWSRMIIKSCVLWMKHFCRSFCTKVRSANG